MASPAKNIWIHSAGRQYSFLRIRNVENAKIGEFTLESGEYIITAYSNVTMIYRQNYTLIAGESKYINIS